MNWSITEDGFVPEEIEKNGSKFMLGNGYMGYRGTLEEFRAGQLTACTLGGLYNKSTGWREPVNMPNPFFALARAGGQTLSILETVPVRHRRGLDLKQAVHWRETVFETEGGRITLSARRLVSHAVLPLMAMEYVLSCDRPVEAEVEFSLDCQIWDLNGPHLSGGTVWEDGVRIYRGRTSEQGVPVAEAQMICGQEVEERPEDGRFFLRLEPGYTAVFHVFAAVTYGGEDPAAQAASIVRQAAEDGFDRVLAAHTAVWSQIWEEADVIIEGDAASDLALRYSLYLLLSSAPFHTGAVAIPARGLSGQVYKGAMFWDTELYMLPFFTAALPEAGRNLVEYRVRTLEGARRKARRLGCVSGAFYAWESQDTGDEACTLHAFTDVFTGRPLRTYFADKQIHISADVAWGILRYHQCTGDDRFLLEGGLEVLLECGRFFWQYAVFRPQTGRYELWDVTSPDEYHERMNNDAYTNLLAGETLDRTLALAGRFLRDYPGQTQAMLERTGLAGVLDSLRDFAQRLYRPGPGRDGVVEQCDGYFGLEDLSVPELLSRKLREDEYLGGANGLASGTQIIKQADVVLASVLLQERFTPEQRRANYAYYAPRTEHGSSLSACVYALAAIDCGRLEEAMDYFQSSVRIDLDGCYKTRVGGLYIGGAHTAAAGGSWMVAVEGFAGLRIGEDGISLDPHLPERWRAVSFHAHWHGQRVACQVRHDQVCVRAAEGNCAPCPVTACGRAILLEPGGSAVLPRLEGREESK